jgi:uncharacterized protein YhfF
MGRCYLKHGVIAVNDEQKARQFWNAYATAARATTGKYTVFRFGDSDELADELVALILAGKKRATTSLVRDFTSLGQPLPEPGNFGVVVDGRNAPRCVIRTTDVSVKPLREVDEDFARDEGGGDRSLAWWRASHARYFKRQGSRDGFSVDDNTQVVLVRFEVVWPPEFANRHAGWI